MKLGSVWGVNLGEGRDRVGLFCVSVFKRVGGMLVTVFNESFGFTLDMQSLYRFDETQGLKRL